MEVEIRAYTPADCPQAAALWNQIVEQGDSFPGDQPLSLPEADAFCRPHLPAAPGWTARWWGFIILHPNNIGGAPIFPTPRTQWTARHAAAGSGGGWCSIPSARRRKAALPACSLTPWCVPTRPAIHLYEQLGFVRIGTIPGGYRYRDGSLKDIYIYYHDTPAQK